MRRVQVTGRSGENIHFPSDSLVVIDGVDVDKDVAGVAKAVGVQRQHRCS